MAIAAILGTINIAQAQAPADPNQTGIVAPPAVQNDPLAAPVPADAGQPIQQPAITPADPNADLPAIDPAQPAPVPKKPAPKKKVTPKGPALPTAKGAILNLDKTAMTVTIDAKGGEQTYKITSKTRIFANAKPAVTGDLTIGEQATIQYRKPKDGSQPEALTLTLATRK